MLKIPVIIDLPLYSDVTAAPVATHWRAVEDPPTEYHQQQTQICAVKLDKVNLTEETAYTIPDSTTGPETSQELDEEGIALLGCSHNFGITVRRTHISVYQS